jgi:hypothetical protein
VKRGNPPPLSLLIGSDGKWGSIGCLRDPRQQSSAPSRKKGAGKTDIPLPGHPDTDSPGLNDRLLSSRNPHRNIVAFHRIQWRLERFFLVYIHGTAYIVIFVYLKALPAGAILHYLNTLFD